MSFNLSRKVIIVAASGVAFSLALASGSFAAGGARAALSNRHPDEQPGPTSCSCSIPEITSILPAVAGPGEVVTITGEHFGDQRLSGFVTFFDNDVYWGVPGDVPQLDVTSWSNKEIEFQVPGSTGTWTTMGGTIATVSVTNSMGRVSSPVELTMSSGISWPQTVNSNATEVQSSEDAYMQTSVTISGNGYFDADTHIWDVSQQTTTSHVKGVAVVTFYGRNGSRLGQWIGGPWSVGNRSSHEFGWTQRIGAKTLDSLYSVSVVNLDPPKSASDYVSVWIASHGSELSSQAQIIAGD